MMVKIKYFLLQTVHNLIKHTHTNTNTNTHSL